MRWACCTTVVLLSLISLPCCQTEAPLSDVPIADSLTHDGGIDAPISTVDAGGNVEDAAPDAPTWAEAGPDFRYGDATLSTGTALYAVGQKADSLSLRRVQTDGSAAPSAVPGFSGLLEFDAILPTALLEPVPITRRRAQPGGSAPFQGISLPNGAGRLLYFHRRLTGTSGLMLIEPTGAISILLEIFGLHSDVLSTRVGLAPDGARGAIVQTPKTLWIFNTNGQALPNGKPAIALNAPSGIAELYARSLTFAGDWVYCVAESAENVRTLLRAKADGSTQLTPVALPSSGGATPQFIVAELAVSADRSHIAMLAGAIPGAVDIYRIVGDTGNAVNITNETDNYALRGEVFGTDEAQLALSADGTKLAYVRGSGGSEELFVAGVAATGPVHVSHGQNFDSAVTTIHNLIFAGNNDLLFMAGVANDQLALFRLQLSSAQVSNLSAGTQTAPFSGMGDFKSRAAWISPNDRWLYVVADSGQASTALRAVDLTTFSTKTILDQGRIALEGSTFAECATTSDLFLVTSANGRDDIWQFDTNAASAATKLVPPASAGRWTVAGLTLNAACSGLSWAAGGSINLRRVWHLALNQAAAPQPVSGVPRFIAPGLRFTPDAASLIYASGGDADTTTLRGVPVAGNQPSALDPSAGFLHIFTVY